MRLADSQNQRLAFVNEIEKKTKAAYRQTQKKTTEIDCNNNQSILRRMKCERGNADVDSIVYFVFYDQEYCQRI